MRRDCTCLGTCKGKEGLAPGWQCALDSVRNETVRDVAWTPGEIHEAVQNNWIPPSVRFVDVSQIRRQLDLDLIVQAVAELPNRTSPNDWPEAMLVTADELKGILSEALRSVAREAT